MQKSLGEEQANMRSRWSDPQYRWANDSELRKRYAKEFRNENETTERQPTLPSSVPNTGSEVGEGSKEGRKG